jgi:flagellar biosynthesis/type III secretory pathway protein FliH
MSAPQLGVLRAAAVGGAAVSIGRAFAPPAVPEHRTARDKADLQPAIPPGYADGFSQGRQAGWREGHAEGLAQGRAEGGRRAADEAACELEVLREELQKQAAQQRDQLQAAAQALGEAKATLLAQAEDELAELATSLAAKVLGPALVNVEGIRAQVQVLLAGRAGPARIRVRPDLAPELERLSAEGLTWIADPSVASGVIVEKNGTQFDARLETVIASFEEHIDRCQQGVAPDTLRDREAP